MAEHLASPLTHIINTCIKLAYFPRAWKVARISPIPKADQPKSDQDYRPISILPALSKIFERLVLQQVNSFICDQALFIDTMSGFRKGHSTVTTLLGIRDDIIRAIRRGEVTLTVLADYSKAFDTVIFKSVILKMHSMGFSKKFLYWTLIYLTECARVNELNTFQDQAARSFNALSPDICCINDFKTFSREVRRFLAD